ncbi:MAG: prolipoprotein diacylglyceryl transferase [Phycisphaerae bacterium]|nr:prolipoprotein diacylglyceryl transferase [Phycisphaerae bacterium]
MCPTLFHLPWLGLPIRGYGLMLMVAFLGGTWWAAHRASRVKADPDLVVNLGFLALIASVVGARIFYVAHYWERFAGRGMWDIVNVAAGGLEFYGGFLGAVAAILVYMHLRKVSIRLYLDIVTPSLMFGMAAARIGCFLNGCCWGAPCDPNMAWGVQFPYGSPAQYRQWEERLMTLPQEILIQDPLNPLTMVPVLPEFLELQKKARAKQAASQPDQTPAVAALANYQRLMSLPEHKSLRVHPVQLYSSMDGLLLAILLSTIFYRRKRHGVVFGWLLLLYPLCRVVEEIIRIDNPHDTAGLTISQFVSLALLTCGVLWLVAMYRLPIRSPLAVPYVPPDLEPSRSNKGRSAKRK